MPTELAGLLRTFWAAHAARLRAALREKDRGASAVELALITALLVGLAAAILAIIIHFAMSQANNISNTTIPNPNGNN
jgi:Flp pilus assembly protein TadG